MISCGIRRLNHTLPTLTQIPRASLRRVSDRRQLQLSVSPAKSCQRPIRDPLRRTSALGRSFPSGRLSLATTVIRRERRSLATQTLASGRRSRVMDEQAIAAEFFPQVEEHTVLQVTSGADPIVDTAFEKLLSIIGDVEDERLRDFGEWIRETAEYNVPQGKRNRLVAVMLAYQSLESGELNAVKLEQAAMLGWCVELLQAFFLISDDIMDNSITRRGRPCWYRQENVGMMAINDAILLESAIYSILKTYFRDHANYVDLLELFHEVTFKTATGQCLDLLTEKKIDRSCSLEDRSCFLEERYDAIVLYKTAFYSYSLPIRLGMYLAGIKDAASHRRAENIALKIGHIFQVQDDYLDCYGKPETIGKIGTDIVEAKCSWLVVKALQIATPQLRTRLLENYGKGKTGEAPELEVKKIYRELSMEEVYREAEERAFNEIKTEIEKLELTETGLKADIFKLLVNKIYRRIK